MSDMGIYRQLPFTASQQTLGKVFTIALVGSIWAAKVQHCMTENVERVYKRALSEMREGQWLAAIKLLKGEGAALQTNWRFSWNLGWCYFKLDKFDAARRH